jgi:hypothetical protein
VYCRWTSVSAAFPTGIVSAESNAYLRERAIAGLSRLIETYKGVDLIEHSLRYYIQIFESKEIVGENILYEKFRQHWTPNEIDVICHMLRQKSEYINAADVILRAKDRLTADTVKALTQGLTAPVAPITEPIVALENTSDL